MRRQILPALLAFLCFTVLTGLVYPLVVTGVSQVAFPNRSDGSLVKRDGKVVGSSLIGQDFEGPRYFHPRPSAAGDGYDAMSSSASNLGPTNQTLLSDVRKRVLVYDALNRHFGAAPGDAVTSSGSGLDPDITLRNAKSVYQLDRVAAKRGVGREQIARLLDERAFYPLGGLAGEPLVNVLEINLELDRRFPVPAAK